MKVDIMATFNYYYDGIFLWGICVIFIAYIFNKLKDYEPSSLSNGYAHGSNVGS